MVVSIITLNYKKPKLTLSCMNSLYGQFKKEFLDDLMELIIVDNASGDDSVNLLKEEINRKVYKNVKILENSVNKGFGGGCNTGSAIAKGEYLLFLNNDTEVKDRGIFEMSKYLDSHKEIAVLGGQLRNKDGSVQASVGSFYTLLKATMLLLGMQKYGLLDKSPKEITRVDWVKGGLFMIRKEIFETLSGFDENIFMYTEDMELCYRAKQMGFNTYFYPKVLVLHKEFGSTNRTFAIVNIYKNLLYFYKKHRSYIEYVFLKSILILKAVVLILVGTLINNSYLKNTYKEALAVI